MKSILSITFVLSSFIMNAQRFPELDSIGGILIVSKRQCIDLPLIRCVKAFGEIGFVINVKEKDMFVFEDGEFSYSAKIKDCYIDTAGLIELNLDICFKRGIGQVSIPAKLSFQKQEKYLKLVLGKRRRKHTKITYEFSPTKYF